MRSLGATVRRRWPDGATGDDLRRHPHSGEEERAGAVLLVEGAGAGGLTEPADVLDAGNSGTTARLLSGILAGQPFFSVLNGDAPCAAGLWGASCSPCARWGPASRRAGRGRCSPWPSLLRRCEGRAWSSASPAPSSSPASCWPGSTPGGRRRSCSRKEPRPHRAPAAGPGGANHRGGQRDLTLAVEGGAGLRAVDVAVPGDVSSGRVRCVAACIHPDARVTVRDVGINPGRTGLLDVLREMGASITVRNERLSGGSRWRT